MLNINNLVNYLKGILNHNYIIRYSGADLSIVVRDACFEPVRKCQYANYFLKVECNWFIIITLEDGKTLYSPVDDS